MSMIYGKVNENARLIEIEKEYLGTENFVKGVSKEAGVGVDVTFNHYVPNMGMGYRLMIKGKEKPSNVQLASAILEMERLGYNVKRGKDKEDNIYIQFRRPGDNQDESRGSRLTIEVSAGTLWLPLGQPEDARIRDADLDRIAKIYGIPTGPDST